MAQEPTVVNFLGIDRSVLSRRADRNSLFDLYNLRHSSDVFGLLEQTPWYNSTTVGAKTYWNGASTAEPATSDVRAVFNNVIITDYTVRSGSWGSNTQVQTLYNTIHTILQCYKHV